jgi:hypothetical protein
MAKAGIDDRAASAWGWFAGIFAASAALVAIGFVALGFYASFPGIAMAGAMAIAAGSAVAGIVEPSRAPRR